MILWKSWFSGPWGRFNLVRIKLSSNLPEEFWRITEYCFEDESQTFGKTAFNTFVKSQTFIMGLEETAWVKMTVMTVGSFQAFIKIMTLIGVLQVRVHVFRTLIFCFSVETFYFSLEDRYVRRSYSQEIEYNPCSFLKTIYPIHVNRFIDVHGFP